VARLVFRSAALRDLASISDHIERESGSLATAEAFTEKIIAYCEKLARLPTVLGRPRPELHPIYRSVTFGLYVIFFFYGDDDAPRGHFYVGNIIHGSRDLDAYFRAYPADVES
jgi:plasmid stabilization system protein ParE